MNKKILSFIFIFICAMFINDSEVFAAEGLGKHGTTATVCQYCKGKSCYYFASENDNKFMLYRQTASKKHEYLDGAESFLDPDWNTTIFNTFVFYQHSDTGTCAPNFYKVPITFDIYDTTFFAPSYDSLEKTTSLMVSKGNGKVTKDSGKSFEYKLLGYYGIDGALTDRSMTSAIGILDSNAVYDTNDTGTVPARGDIRGCAVLTGPVLEKINWVLNLIKYLGASLVIILGALDFFKAILADDAKENSKAWKRFTTRLIAAVLLFLVPLIIQFLLTTVKIEGVNVDAPTCNIGVTN